MIFITLGTQDKSFKRLLKEVDILIDNKIIKEKVVAQVGFTDYKSNNMEVHKYLDMEEFEKNLVKANLVITHGGVGSILTALQNDKKVIAIPRLSKYKEHVNDHQLQIANKFREEGYILSGDVKELGNLILKSKSFTPLKYTSNNKQFNNLIIKYIDNL